MKSVNDNKPIFREKEIELKFNKNILKGYKIPFEGAKDLDENENNKIEYKLNCLNENIGNCYLLFKLIIISQSFSLNYDQLGLKFIPLSSIEIKNEYKLKISAFDIDKNENILYLNIRIKQNENEEKYLKFSLLKYEFILLLNSSTNLIENRKLIGHVYANSTNKFDKIYYKLLTNDQNLINLIEINSLTGEIYFINKNKNILPNKNQIEFNIQASILSQMNSTNLLIKKCQIKIFIRYLNKLNNILFKFKFNSSKISKLNNSNSFFILKKLKINENLFEIFLSSFYYLNDEFILSLENYLNLFSLILLSNSSNSSRNNYLLKLNQNLIFNSIYILNISIKHKLTQEYLINLKIKLIFIDQYQTTTIKNENSQEEFCKENENLILYEINEKTKEKNEIILLKINKTNLILINKNENLFLSFNKTNFILINKCQMFIEKFNKNVLNKTFKYKLCFNNSIKNKCYNIKLENNIYLSSTKTIVLFPIKLILFIILIISIFIIFIFILLIYRLKQNLFNKNFHQHSTTTFQFQVCFFFSLLRLILKIILGNK